MNFFEKLKEGLKKTRESFSAKLRGTFAFFKSVDEDFLDKLEETLIMSDVSVSAASKIREKLRSKVKFDGTDSPEEIKKLLKNIIEEILFFNSDNTDAVPNTKNIDEKRGIILAVGVNGVGKTTTLGKMAFKFKNDGKKVLLAAADTFRAAAADQLEIWARRTKCEIVRKRERADPGSVVFEAILKAKSENFDLILCDTAGRLHNNPGLMAELGKIERIADKNFPEAVKETFLVLDASTGQNMLSQAEEFSKILKITGIILTKLDGTARGGAVISVKDKFNIPIKYIGIGESCEDFKEFEAKEFAGALFSEGD
jgi:fused signal recognition particle receptor